MGKRSWELVATDESTILAKSFPDPTVVEDGESNSCFTNPPCPNKSDGFEVFGESNDILDQLVASETVARRWWRRLAERRAMKR